MIGTVPWARDPGLCQRGESGLSASRHVPIPCSCNMDGTWDCEPTKPFLP